MGALLYNTRLVHCYSYPQSGRPATTKWLLSNSGEIYNFWVRKEPDGKLTSHADGVAVGNKEMFFSAQIFGVNGQGPQEWHNELTKRYKVYGAIMHDCDQCKHKLACMVVPTAVRTFENRE